MQVRSVSCISDSLRAFFATSARLASASALISVAEGCGGIGWPVIFGRATGTGMSFITGRGGIGAAATAGFGAAAAAPLTRRVLEPFAAAGCDLERFADSAPEAPLGGWFDVDAAQEEFIPPTQVSSD